MEWNMEWRNGALMVQWCTGGIWMLGRWNGGLRCAGLMGQRGAGMMAGGTRWKIYWRTNVML
eukprot:4348253-Lingulodinium_polyedra.AAC.1